MLRNRASIAAMKATLTSKIAVGSILGCALSFGFVLGFGATHGFWSEETAAWVQAVGSIAAIIATALIFHFEQEGRVAEATRDAKERSAAAKQERYERARTAGELALNATNLVAARLEASLASINGSTLYALRGHRTTEMVQAMRELQIDSVPSDVMERFAYIRSGIYAVNARITDVFDSEKNKKGLRERRYERLKSAGRVLGETLVDLQKLTEALAELGQTIAPPTISKALEPFINEATEEKLSSKDAED